MSESLSLRGTMKGHNDWVTAIATTYDPCLCFHPVPFRPFSAGASRSGNQWEDLRGEGAGTWEATGGWRLAGRRWDWSAV